MELDVFAANPIELLVVQVHGECDRNHHLFRPPVKKYSAQVVHRVKVVQQGLVIDEEGGLEYQKVAVISDGIGNLVQVFPRNLGLARVRLGRVVETIRARAVRHAAVIAEGPATWSVSAALVSC